MKLALIYGGKSGEHEVSLLSAASVLRHLDRTRFEIIPISIDKNGVWRRHDLERVLKAGQKSLPVFMDDAPVSLLPASKGQAKLVTLDAKAPDLLIDIAFPMLHGPLCEDGSLQGLLELADIPYIGSGVAASALGMDKDLAKRLYHAAGIPVTPFVVVHKREWVARRNAILSFIDSYFSEYPLFVKPVNMGSSVGVHKVKKHEEFIPALEDALRYDRKVLVEQGIPAREIEFSVIEDLDPAKPPFVSNAGEVIPSAKHEFYSYESKYLDENGAEFEIPAEVSSTQLAELQDYARRAFLTLGCAGFARVDFLVHQTTGQIYLNEINTLPGFTSISMFPKMLEASGLPYPAILTRLIDLGLRDYQERQALTRDYLKKP